MGEMKKHETFWIIALREHLVKYGHLFLHLMSCPTIGKEQVGNALVDPYVCQLWWPHSSRTDVQWISSQNHDGYIVVQCLKCMLKSGLNPDATTFTCNIHCNSGLF